MSETFELQKVSLENEEFIVSIGKLYVFINFLYAKREFEKRRKEVNAIEYSNESKASGIGFLMVWSNQKLQRWANQLGLREYSLNLHESGVHGALLCFDEKFTWKDLAVALRIPSTDVRVSK